MVDFAGFTSKRGRKTHFSVLNWAGESAQLSYRFACIYAPHFAELVTWLTFTRRQWAHDGLEKAVLIVDPSKRAFLKRSALLAIDALIARYSPAFSEERRSSAGAKVILLISGGVRRQETFSETGRANIPNLSGKLLAESVFYANVRNDGVTSHFNTTSSILTGNWQRVDAWGNQRPATPTVFEFLRKDSGLTAADAWLVSSNKALTQLIAASSAREYGPAFGANAIFPKQLLINAVEDAIQEGRKYSLADKNRAQDEINRILGGSNYEGLGWNVFDGAAELDPRARDTIQRAVAALVHDNGPVTGDEFTYLMSVEIMRRFAPSLLVVGFSDVEAAHFGSYAMHLGGIRNFDRLAGQLWEEIQTNEAYRDRTTLFILPEFGRDFDGSNTNGFFNHRSDSETCRNTWMLCLGKAAKNPHVHSGFVHHVDMCPTIAALLGGPQPPVTGRRLDGLEY